MSDEVTARTHATGWRNSPQIMAGIDGALTAAAAAIVGPVVAMFIDKDWTLPENLLLPLLGTIGLLGALQRVTQRSMDLPLTPGGESEDERIRRLVREVLHEKAGGD